MSNRQELPDEQSPNGRRGLLHTRKRIISKPSSTLRLLRLPRLHHLHPRTKTETRTPHSPDVDRF